MCAGWQSGSGGGGSNTLPRPLTGGGQGYGPRARHGAVRRGVPACDDAGSPAGKSLTDYEREISELRTAMETLKVKLTEAESRLVQESSSQRAEGEVRVIVNRLAEDEDQLRRTENYANGGQG